VALRSNEFKLKSGINRVLPTGYPPIYSVFSLSSLPLRAEEVTVFCFWLLFARSSLARIKSKTACQFITNYNELPGRRLFAKFRNAWRGRSQRQLVLELLENQTALPVKV
jgi:hypothetical protein